MEIKIFTIWIAIKMPIESILDKGICDKQQQQHKIDLTKKNCHHIGQIQKDAYQRQTQQ